MGDFHGLNTMEYQPTKIAAMEGNWETDTNVPLLLFALPSNEQETNLVEFGIPDLASKILTHSADGKVPGITEAAADERPPVWLVFWSFRTMVGIGMLMILIGIWGLYKRVRGRLSTPGWMHRALFFAIPLPFVAVVAGWFTTEVGRSPWLVYGVINHAQGITPSLTGGLAMTSLIGFLAVYLIVYASGIYYLLQTVTREIYSSDKIYQKN